MADGNELEEEIVVVEEGISTSTDSGPSLQNPTWQYLHENFTKIQLQKHCRELGLTKIWVLKEKLINMIMERQGPPRDDTAVTRNEEDDSSIHLQRMMKDIAEIKEKLSRKDQ